MPYVRRKKLNFWVERAFCISASCSHSLPLGWVTTEVHNATNDHSDDDNASDGDANDQTDVVFLGASNVNSTLWSLEAGNAIADLYVRYLGEREKKKTRGKSAKRRWGKNRNESSAILCWVLCQELKDAPVCYCWALCQELKDAPVCYCWALCQELHDAPVYYCWALCQELHDAPVYYCWALCQELHDAPVYYCWALCQELHDAPVYYCWALCQELHDAPVYYCWALCQELHNAPVYYCWALCQELHNAPVYYCWALCPNCNMYLTVQEILTICFSKNRVFFGGEGFVLFFSPFFSFFHNQHWFKDWSFQSYLWILLKVV